MSILSGVPSRLATSVATASGDASVSSTTAYGWTDAGDLETVDGPLSGSADVARYRYDASRRLVGVIGPDPDGGGALKHRALRVSYNARGLANKVEQGTVSSQSDAHWAAFSPLAEKTTAYDGYNRPVETRVFDGSLAAQLVQTGYDSLGRPECVAVRMNPSFFASPPSSACAPGTPGPFGADRISKTVYDAAGQVLKTLSGVGTGLEQETATMTWTANGLAATVSDAKGNKTTYAYDGLDRLKKTRFPDPSTPGTSSATDYEELSWSDAGATRGLLAGRRLRDGTSYAYEYDALGRLTLSDAPAGTADVAYEYDLFGRLVEALGGGGTLGYAYDALGRLLSETQGLGTVSYQYDAAGRRTKMTYPGPGGFYVDYDWRVSGELYRIRENGATAGIGVLAAFSYDDLGRRVSVMRGNGVETAYGHDGASRLTSLSHDPAGTGDDQSWEFDRNPAGQIVSQTAALSGWGWTMGSDYSEAYTANGLNQHLTVAGASVSHDARGNMTSDGLGRSFAYDAANRLTSVSGAGAATLSYDPAGRLREVAGTATTRFLYDGADVIAEYDDTDALLRRYVHGPGLDEPLVWYEGTGAGDRRFLLSDPRGSVVAVTDGAGAVTDVNKYDDYGAPASGNLGRFQFTGQMWLEEAGLYHYKARAYHPALGRFMQTDPIGYGDGMNMYAYVGNDPVNRRDPSGMVATGKDGDHTKPPPKPDCPGGFADCITAPGGSRSPGGGSSPMYMFAGALAHFSGGGFNRGMFGGGGGVNFLPRRDAPKPKSNNGVEEIVVTATRPPGDYLDGLVSTGFFSCDGYCAPTIDYRFDDSGLTIVAKRVDTLARLKAKRAYYQAPYNMGLYELEMRKRAQAEAVCISLVAASSFSFLTSVAHRETARRATQASARFFYVGAGILLTAYVYCGQNGIGIQVESN